MNMTNWQIFTLKWGFKKLVNKMCETMLNFNAKPYKFEIVPVLKCRLYYINKLSLSHLFDVGELLQLNP